MFQCEGKLPCGFWIFFETLPPCLPAADQKADLKEIAKDKSVKKQNLHNSALEPLAFGQETLFPHSHAFSSTVLTCADGLHVEEKQKMRDGNVIPDTPPSTPSLVPSQAPFWRGYQEVNQKLKGELAKEFVPPHHRPHLTTSSVSSLSENEQNAIEKRRVHAEAHGPS